MTSFIYTGAAGIAGSNASASSEATDGGAGENVDVVVSNIVVSSNPADANLQIAVQGGDGGRGGAEWAGFVGSTYVNRNAGHIGNGGSASTVLSNVTNDATWTGDLVLDISSIGGSGRIAGAAHASIAHVNLSSAGAVNVQINAGTVINYSELQGQYIPSSASVSDVNVTGNSGLVVLGASASQNNYNLLYLPRSNVSGNNINFNGSIAGGGLGASFQITATSYVNSVVNNTIHMGGGNDDIYLTIITDTFAGAFTGDITSGGLTFSGNIFDGGDGVDTIHATIVTNSTIIVGGVHQAAPPVYKLDMEDNTYLSIERIEGTETGGTGSFNIIKGNAEANSIFGKSGNDQLAGRGGADLLSGAGGDDTLDGGAGNDTLQGDEGTDTAVFTGNKSDYVFYLIDAVENTIQVKDRRPGSPDGRDTLYNIETLRFADVTVDISSLTFSPFNSDPTGHGTAILPHGTEDIGYVIAAASLLQGFSDPEGQALSVTSLSVDHGTVVVNPNGTFTVNPNGNFNGTMTLTYVVSDGHDGSTVGVQSVTFDAVNDAPTFTGPKANLPFDYVGIPVVIAEATLTAGFSDIDGDALHVLNMTADHGTVVNNNNGTFTVTPTGGFKGTLGLSYQVSDGHGGSVAATQKFTVVTQLTPGTEAAVSPPATVGFDPSITGLKGGGYVVTWTGPDASAFGVWAQTYDATGAKIGVPVQVNTFTQHGQFEPSITALNDGGYVIAWSSLDQTPLDSSYGIFFQQYDAFGNEVGGEKHVNAYVTAEQQKPVVTALKDGGFVVGWQSFGEDGSDFGIFVQRYDASGAKVGDETPVNTSKYAYQEDPAIAALQDGGFIVTWDGFGLDPSSIGVSSQRFDATGTKVGVEVLVNKTTDFGQSSAVPVGLSDGGYLVVWISAGDLDGSLAGIFLQRYDASGAKIGDETQVNTYTVNDQYRPTVTVLTDDSYVVTWDSDGQDGSGKGVYAKRYDSNGVMVEDEFRVNDTPNGDQMSPAVTALQNGGYAIAWASTQDGGIYSVYQKLFAPGNHAPVGSATGTLAAGTEDTAYVVSAALLKSGFSDPDGDAISVTGLSANCGTVVDNLNGTFTITPTFNYYGQAILSYTISDGRGGTLPGQTLSFILADVNDAPTGAATATLVHGTEDTNYVVSSADLLAGFSDVDGNPLSVINLVANHGTVTDNGNGTFTIVPEPDYFGVVNLIYSVSDGQASIAASRSFTLDQVVDLVTSSKTTALAPYKENLTLTGTADINGNGNALDNVLTGNAGKNNLKGLGGNDYIDGGLGADSLFGGLGNDSYVVDNVGDVVSENVGEGTDIVLSSVTFTLGANIEKVTLTGSAAINGTGNTLANLLLGNDGNNRLDGKGGADTMAGGIGNDTYVVDSSGDVVTELNGAGTDTIETSLSYVLGATIENLTLTGTLDRNGNGNGLDNVIKGNSGINILRGLGGNDIVDGGAGADRLYGGTGNDTFIVDNVGDVLIENAGEGTDTIQTALNYVLGANIENLTLTGTLNRSGNGNTLNNLMLGNSGNNVLKGLDGIDTLNGAAGADTLWGGIGGDTFVFSLGSGVDAIKDFSVGQGDLINVNAYSHGVAFSGGVTITADGLGNTIVNLGSGNIVTVSSASVVDVTNHMVW